LGKDVEKTTVRCIKIDGEDDLTLLPVIKYFPNGYTIVYGFHGIGLMKITINNELKKKVDWVFSKMERKGYGQ